MSVADASAPRPATAPVAVAWTAAVAATAAVGGLGTDVSSRWYRRLALPSFQPPGPAFGIVWTILYALIAIAATRATVAARDGDERRRIVWAFAANLLLNVAWTWIFFRGHRAGAAGVEILALQASTLLLIRQLVAVDRTASRLLVPYAAWVGFATVLTWTIAIRNR
ncbi:TspO/MBR family protein [Paraconexibacter algicola]|uniref:TspO protein n=1 Tax=Paraconexibacter algicola TaxID=2133960 RepID=A0A2T4UEU9_9ACTN|nr:TspO/MBR family protein [Paraconexibacter algicola]PTL56313.1 TspO protein [Paraconexibacter algicola]